MLWTRVTQSSHCIGTGDHPEVDQTPLNCSYGIDQKILLDPVLLDISEKTNLWAYSDARLPGDMWQCECIFQTPTTLPWLGVSMTACAVSCLPNPTISLRRPLLKNTCNMTLAKNGGYCCMPMYFGIQLTCDYHALT